MAISIKKVVQRNAQLISIQHSSRGSSSLVSMSMVNSQRNGRRFQFTKAAVNKTVDESTITTTVDEDGVELRFAPFQLIPDVEEKKVYLGQNLDESAATFNIKLDNPILYRSGMVQDFTKAFGIVYGRHVSFSFSGKIDITDDGKKIAVFDMTQHSKKKAVKVDADDVVDELEED